MTDNVKAWPKPTGTPLDLPRRIVRPCDYGLAGAVRNLEVQLGTIEAYNRLVEAATALRARIESGDVKAQNPIFAVHVTGGPRHG